MRETGEIRVRLNGDTEAAQRYIGQARVFLGMLKQSMQVGKLLQGGRRFVLPDGTEITVQSIFGRDIVSISAVAPTQELVQQQEEPVLGQSVDISSVVAAGYWEDAGGFAGGSFIWTKAGGVVDIPFLPGCYYGRATGISADGKIVVGTCGGDDGDYAYRWTKSEGTQNLGNLGGAYQSSGATSVSGDGGVICGNGLTAHGNIESWRWSKGVFTIFAGSNGTWDQFGVPGVSSNGKYVTGVVASDGYVWSEALGQVSVPRPGTSQVLRNVLIVDEGGYITKMHMGDITVFDRSIPSSVSDNGVVVGATRNVGAFVWDSIKGDYTLIGTGDVVGLKITPDGKTIVGYWNKVDGEHAFYWNAKIAPYMLGEGRAYDVSSDGAIIVGGAGPIPTRAPAVWDKKGGTTLIPLPAGGAKGALTAVATPKLTVGV